MDILRITAKDALMQNSYLVISNRTCILIDTGVNYNQIQTEFEKSYPSKHFPNITAILLTHCHFDHIAYLEELQKQFNCPVYFRQGFEKNISTPTINASSLFDSSLNYAPTNLKLLPNETPFQIEDIIVTPVFTPGHTNCSVCYQINKDLFTGDTLFASSYGRTDLPSGNAQQMLSSLKKLSSLDIDICYPGHGVPFYYNKK